MNNKAIFRKSILGVAIATVSAGYQSAFAGSATLSATGSAFSHGNNVNIQAAVGGTNPGFGIGGNVNINGGSGGSTGGNVNIRGGAGIISTGNGGNVNISGGAAGLFSGHSGNVHVKGHSITLVQGTQNFNTGVPANNYTASGNVIGAGSTAQQFVTGAHPKVNASSDGTYTGTGTTYSGTGTTSTDYFIVDNKGSTTSVSDTNNTTTTTTNRVVTVANGGLNVDTVDNTSTVTVNSNDYVTQHVGDFFSNLTGHDERGSQLSMENSSSTTTSTGCTTTDSSGHPCSSSTGPTTVQTSDQGLVENTAAASTTVHSHSSDDGAGNVTNTTSTLTLNGDSAAFTAQDNVNNTQGAFLIGTDSASVTVTNSLGHEHGLWVGTNNTVLSGGTSSTTLTLDNSGAHLDNTLDMGGHTITNVGPGVNGTDVVNLNQLNTDIANVVSANSASEGDLQYGGTLTSVNGQSLTTAISTENSQRVAADTTLQNNIDSEATTRANADTTLQNNINTEASTRASADTTLQNNINTEATTRANADTTLQNNINSEATTRANADTALQNSINSNSAADAAETAARKRADHELSNRIDDVKGGVASAIALTSAQMPSAPGKTAVSIGVGFYGGENAIGINAVHKLANNGNIGVGIAQSSGHGDTAGKISYGFEF